MKLELKKLKDLEIGDKFYPASQHGLKNMVFYTVHGNAEYNIQYECTTRSCVNHSSNYLENKSCRMEVMFIPKVKEDS